VTPVQIWSGESPLRASGGYKQKHVVPENGSGLTSPSLPTKEAKETLVGCVSGTTLATDLPVSQEKETGGAPLYEGEAKARLSEVRGWLIDSTHGRKTSAAGAVIGTALGLYGQNVSQETER
jgi:hypothetical protein